MAYILPQIEQGNLYNSIDFRVEMADSGQCNNIYGATISESHINASASRAVVPAFLCPSDPASHDNQIVMGSANPASDSYAANAGWPSWSLGIRGERSAPNATHNGLMAMNSPSERIPWHVRRVRMGDVTDGLTNTVAISERLIMQAQSSREIRNADLRMVSRHTTERARVQSEIQRNCELAHHDTFHSAFQGRAWISGWTLTAPTYMHVYPPNKWNCHYHGGEGSGDNVITPSSNHTGGVNATLGDGSVHFISQSIDSEVWWLLGSRNDGEVVELPQ
jgi:hypothetical protein